MHELAQVQIVRGVTFNASGAEFLQIARVTRAPQTRWMGIAKEVGDLIYGAAGESSGCPPPLGALQLALNIHRPGVFVESKLAQVEACTAIVNGKTRIVLRFGLHPRRRHFAIARMLARLELKRLGAWSHPAERAVASYLVAPASAVGSFIRANGFDLPRLARRFVITETCAALRVIEVGADGGVVVTPDTVYRPRGGLGWVDDETVRRLALKPGLRSARRCIITDEPARVALFTRAA